MDLPSIKCPVFPGHQRAGVREVDLTVVLQSPRVGEFAWAGPGECLITERTLRTFHEASLTGYEVGPVKVERVKRLPRDSTFEVPKLYELRITGRAGHVHRSSGVRITKKCSYCGLVEYSDWKRGVIIDETQWDGSDFSTTIEFPAIIMVTERVKDVIVANELKPCALTPARKMPTLESSLREAAKKVRGIYRLHRE